MKRLFASLVILRAIPSQATETVWLDSLDLNPMRQGWGTPQVNRSIRETPLAIGGREFERGVGTHATSTYRLLLNDGTDCFTASVGADDAASNRDAQRAISASLRPGFLLLQREVSGHTAVCGHHPPAI